MPRVVGQGKNIKGKDVSSTERSTEAKKGKKVGAKEGRRGRDSSGGGESGAEKAANSSNRHSECSASEAPVSLHPTPERKKKKKRKKRRSKSSDASGSQKEGDLVTNTATVYENVEEGKCEEGGGEKRKGCKDCLMENCTGAVTLYRYMHPNFLHI